MGKNRVTGYRDKNGKMILEGDLFKWTMPEGFINPHAGYDPLVLAIELVDGIPHGMITEDTTTTSRVVFENNRWELHGIGEDEGWVTVLHSTVPRNEYGEVVNG